MQEPDSTAMRNLLLIGVDSLRADRLSCYGYPRPSTPHIDRLASQGVLFEHMQLQPIVTLAPGGTLAELYQDSAIRVAPVDAATAHAMIEEVRGLAPVRGYRGMPRGDLSALANAVVAVSNLAAIEGSSRPVSEAEINPLIVRGHGEGVAAVDALMVLTGC